MKYLILLFVIINSLAIIYYSYLGFRNANPKNKRESQRYFTFSKLLFLSWMIFMIILGNLNGRAEAKEYEAYTESLQETDDERKEREARIEEKQQYFKDLAAKQEAEAKAADEKAAAEAKAREEEQAKAEAEKKAKEAAEAKEAQNQSAGYSYDEMIRAEYGNNLSESVARRIIEDHLGSGEEISNYRYNNGNVSLTILGIETKDKAALLYSSIGDYLLEYDEMGSLKIYFDGYGAVDMSLAYVEVNMNGGRYFPTVEIEDQLGIVYGDEEFSDDYDYDSGNYEYGGYYYYDDEEDYDDYDYYDDY